MQNPNRHFVANNIRQMRAFGGPEGIPLAGQTFFLMWVAPVMRAEVERVLGYGPHVTWPPNCPIRPIGVGNEGACDFLLNAELPEVEGWVEG